MDAKEFEKIGQEIAWAFYDTLNKPLTDIMFGSNTYELVSVSYLALSKSPDKHLKVFAEESKEMGSHELLKRLRQYEKQGQILGESWLQGNKYFVMINHDNLNPDEWYFKPCGVPEDIFKKDDSYLGLVHQQYLEARIGDHC